MKRKFHTPEQIIKKLREADAIMAQGGNGTKTWQTWKLGHFVCSEEYAVH